jgi:hypothetical protein
MSKDLHFTENKNKSGKSFLGALFQKKQKLATEKGSPKRLLFSHHFFPLILFGIGLQFLLFLLPILLYSYKSPKLLLPTSPLLSLFFFFTVLPLLYGGLGLLASYVKKQAIYELFRKGTLVIFLLSLFSSLPLFLHPLYCSRTSALLSKADVQEANFLYPYSESLPDSSREAIEKTLSSFPDTPLYEMSFFHYGEGNIEQFQYQFFFSLQDVKESIMLLESTLNFQQKVEEENIFYGNGKLSEEMYFDISVDKKGGKTEFSFSNLPF